MMLSTFETIPAWAEDVRKGLTGRPRRLPAHLLYDARGSDLFEAITRLPEYYLTRTELQILKDNADAIAAHAGPSSVIELGAGSGRKTKVVLEAVRDLRGSVTYHPIDVSRAALDSATRRLTRRGIGVYPLVGRYEDALPLIHRLPGPRMVMFIGSSVGNLGPVGALKLLKQVRAALQPGDSLLVGADVRKEPEIMLPAYDDVAGVTSVFELNALERLNRELHADFHLDGFKYRALWDAERSCIRMGLESLREQTVRIPPLDLVVRFGRGEFLQTERSYKWSVDEQEALLERAGFESRAVFRDPRRWFAVHLARVAE